MNRFFLPSRVDEVTLLRDDFTWATYPLNFIPFEEDNDGAGDYYGLYWALGQEQQEPIVCRHAHEEDALYPEYRNLADFLARYPASYALRDETFFLSLFLRAKVLARKGEDDEAYSRLLLSTRLFADYSASWTLLAERYQRRQQWPEAAHAIRRALLANWQLGQPDARCLHLFTSLPLPAELTTDPLFSRRESLFTAAATWQEGFSIDYQQLWSIVQAYAAAGDARAAVCLARNYGYALAHAPVETQQQLHFNPHQWMTELTALRHQLNF